MIDIYQSGKYDIDFKFNLSDIKNLLEALENLKKEKSFIIKYNSKSLYFHKNENDNIYSYIKLKSKKYY